MNERIFFKVRIDIPNLDTYDATASKSALMYEGELVWEGSHNYFIKIFFNSIESLDRKVMSYETGYSHTLLSQLVVEEISSPSSLKHIDFCNYDFKGMQSGRYDDDGKWHFTIILNGIKLTYESSEQRDSEIYLNHTAFPLMELNYRYSPNFSWRNDQFKFEPLNNIKDFITFNDIKFIPENNFYVSTKGSEKVVNITKEPRLRIQHENLTAAQVLRHAELLSDLFSFYTEKKISWGFYRIYAEGKLFVESRDILQEENKFIHGAFIWDFAQNPLNLVRNVDAKFLFENYEIVSKLIERYYYAVKVSDEAKFMILYSILEELRNYYILAGEIEKSTAGTPPNLSRVKEEYKFIHGNDKTNDWIKEALKKVSEIINSDEKELFEKEIPLKVSGVRLMSMTNQFESYFKHVAIDLKHFDLDFKELKSLRDTIFHGRPIKNKEYLKKVIWYKCLPRLTGELLIKFFGIRDLKKIELNRIFG